MYHGQQPREGKQLNRMMMSGMFFGLVTIVTIVLVASFIISLCLKFTGLTEASFTTVTLLISFVALFIGGIISGKKVQARGWFIGGGTGILYTIVVFSVQYLGFDSGFTTKQYLFFALYIAVAALGGIIGVNLTSNRRQA